MQIAHRDNWTVTVELNIERLVILFVNLRIVIAELLPSYYHLELPRPVENTLVSQPDCLPTSAARCCAAPLKSDPDRFIIGSEDGTLHTVRFTLLVIQTQRKSKVINVSLSSFRSSRVTFR